MGRHIAAKVRQFPVFPLPEGVLFPGVVLPLPLFDLRHRRMAEDAMATDQCVVVATVATAAARAADQPPAVEAVGCLGRLIHLERQASGDTTVLVQGLERVALLHELIGEVAYRRFAVASLPPSPLGHRELQASLTGLRLAVARLAAAAAPYDAQLVAVLQSTDDMVNLCDILAAVLVNDRAEQQQLLATPCLKWRLEALEKVVWAQERRFRQPLCLQAQS